MVFCGTPHHPFSTPKGRSRYKYIYICTQTSTLQRILFEPCFGFTSYDTPTPIHSWHPYRVRVDITPEFSVLVFWFPVFPRISRNNGGTKLIILCSPGNPTGGVWVPEISKQKKTGQKILGVLEEEEAASNRALPMNLLLVGWGVARDATFF